MNNYQQKIYLRGVLKSDIKEDENGLEIKLPIYENRDEDTSTKIRELAFSFPDLPMKDKNQLVESLHKAISEVHVISYLKDSIL